MLLPKDFKSRDTVPWYSRDLLGGASRAKNIEDAPKPPPTSRVTSGDCLVAGFIMAFILCIIGFCLGGPIGAFLGIAVGMGTGVFRAIIRAFTG